LISPPVKIFEELKVLLYTVAKIPIHRAITTKSIKTKQHKKEYTSYL
jgi:hypothetical protein